MKLKITLLAVLITGALFAQQKITKTFEGIDRITIGTGSSDCVVKKSNNNTVTVEVLHYYDKYEPSIEQNGSTLRIKENNRNGSGWRSYGEKSPVWTISVPDDIDFKYSTGSGDFMASDLNMELDVNAGSGDILLKNMKGDVVSNTGSGDMSLGGFDGYLSANTGSGDLEISDVKGDIKLNCGSGDIDIRDLEGSVSANVGSGDIEADNVIVNNESSFNSGSGDVEVGLSSSPTASLSVNSGSGNAELDYNGNDIKGTIVMKANKRNGDIRAPFDFDTTEEIDKYNQTMVKKTKKMDNTNIEIRIGTGSGTASIER